MVARQTLTLFVRVRILLRLPLKSSFSDEKLLFYHLKMTHFRFISFTAVSPAGCVHANEVISLDGAETQFEQIIRWHAARYPAMQPQDFAKLAYQSEFGPAHLAQTADDLSAALLREWGALPADMPARPSEPIGGGLCRLHLDPQTDAARAVPLLAALIHRTARMHHGTADGLHRRIAALRRLNAAGMADWLDRWQVDGCPSIHHSRTFHTAYQPHYRVILTAHAVFFPALLAAARLTQNGVPAVLAIDGRCGSGKSSLAQLLNELFGCNILHIDDFYLPAQQRTPDWTEQPAGNIDLARFWNEALAPARAGKPIYYRAYSCKQQQYRNAVLLSPTPLTVVEGSYSQHPALASAYHCRIFLTCPAEVQQRRLRAREGTHFGDFAARWIPMEERYFAACGVPDADTIVIDTNPFF